MRLARTEQWLILAVMLAAAAWVGMMVYARLQPVAEVEPEPREEPASAGPETEAPPAIAAAPATAGSSDMVFSVDDLAATAAPATAAPASAAPATTAPASAAPTTAAGRSETILVRSDPMGARLMDAQTLVGRTPMEFPRPAEIAAIRYLSVQKTGFRSARIAITPTSPARIDVTLDDR